MSTSRPTRRYATLAASTSSTMVQGRRQTPPSCHPHIWACRITLELLCGVKRTQQAHACQKSVPSAHGGSAHRARPLARCRPLQKGARPTTPACLHPTLHTRTHLHIDGLDALRDRSPPVLRVVRQQHDGHAGRPAHVPLRRHLRARTANAPPARLPGRAKLTPQVPSLPAVTRHPVPPRRNGRGTEGLQVRGHAAVVPQQFGEPNLAPHPDGTVVAVVGALAGLCPDVRVPAGSGGSSALDQCTVPTGRRARSPERSAQDRSASRTPHQAPHHAPCKVPFDPMNTSTPGPTLWQVHRMCDTWIPGTSQRAT